MKRKAIFLLYRLLQALTLPVTLGYFVVRCLRNRAYFATLHERRGELSALWQKTAPGAIWVHAVSVGEVLAAVPLVGELKKRSPRIPVFVSTSTLAGRAIANERLNKLAEGIFYAPLDFVWAVRRVLRRMKPSVVVVLETEIWPNLFREVTRIGCGLIMVNGRISDRTAARYKSWSWVFGIVLGMCDRILAQSDAMRQRFIAAGAPSRIVTASGNLKYDFVPVELPPDSPVLRFVHAGKGSPLWVAASTSTDGRLEEEDAVLAAQGGLEGWRLIIAPRKPDRFETVAKKLTASGLRWTRRTDLSDPNADVLLLDSIGELAGVFAHADVVFMGGTLAEMGGHNILEPAIHAKPVIAGPHLENFREMEQHFESHNALLRIASGKELRDAVLRAAADPELGRRAQLAASLERGATARAADDVMELYESRYPCYRPPQPSFAFRWFWSQIWRAASALDRRRKRSNAKRLPVPVICVGNITVGGTGKTPAAIELLRELADMRPGLLMRGHGRHSRDIVVLPRGTESVPIALTGDEAQLYMKAVAVPIAISGNRYKAGLKLLQDSNVGILLLDDGFQHLQLHRDFDLVLIDALNPFGGRHLVPLGRLREPMTGLARANTFLITRSDEVPNTAAIESVLRHYNPKAAVFHARTVRKRWINRDGATLEEADLRTRRSVAFCGIGNPESFWRTVRAAGITPVERHTFDDHHRYAPSEIRRLSHRARDLRADLLLTTAKDAVNLCPEIENMLHGVHLYWLEIEVEIHERAQLLDLILAHTGNRRNENGVQ